MLLPPLALPPVTSAHLHKTLSFTPAIALSPHSRHVGPALLTPRTDAETVQLKSESPAPAPTGRPGTERARFGSQACVTRLGSPGEWGHGSGCPSWPRLAPTHQGPASWGVLPLSLSLPPGPTGFRDKAPLPSPCG